MLLGMERTDRALVLKLDTEVSDPADGDIQGFAIAGEDRKFHPAEVAYAEKGKADNGRIQYDRKQLVLTSPMVPEPVHFRYAWGRNPLANLQAIGNNDLPFATQRSDTWRMEESPWAFWERMSACRSRAATATRFFKHSASRTKIGSCMRPSKSSRAPKMIRRQENRISGWQLSHNSDYDQSLLPYV